MSVLHPWSNTAPPAQAPSSYDHWPRQWQPLELRQMSAIRREITAALLAEADPVELTTVDDALLVIDELLSNGLPHGLPPVTLMVDQTSTGWVVTVTDHAVHTPLAPTADRDPALGGMGLGRVSRVARATGWWSDGAKKVVWAVIESPTGTPAAC